jgi:hypothetical protein
MNIEIPPSQKRPLADHLRKPYRNGQARVMPAPRWLRRIAVLANKHDALTRLGAFTGSARHGCCLLTRQRMSAFEQIVLQKSANGRPNFFESKERTSFAHAEVGLRVFD